MENINTEKNEKENTLSFFIEKLSSKEPVPGGGGASALIGAIGAALCSMVANLTSGKKKYEEYQTDIDNIILSVSMSITRLLELIDKDAEVFKPLSAAYGIPKEDPKRDEILEDALVSACSAPMEILKETAYIINFVESLAVKGSKLALSDIGAAASACRCAMECAVMNIYINTKLMKKRDFALKINKDAEIILNESINRCNAVYQKITNELINL